MPLTINDLPFEILSQILQEAAEFNIQHGPLYTYGLSQAPEPLQDARLQRVVRGQLPPDTLVFNATEDIRQVARRWHDWAADYALKTLYISRWRGSERYLNSCKHQYDIYLQFPLGGYNRGLLRPSIHNLPAWLCIETLTTH